MDIKTLIESEAAKEVKAIESMEAQFGKEAIRLQVELYELLKDKFIASLQTDESGNLLYNAKNITRVNDLNKTWEVFQEQHYKPVVVDFAKNLVSIVDIEAGYFLALGKQFDLNFEFGKITDLISKQIGIDLKTEAITEGSYLARLLEGSQVKNTVADYVLSNVSAKVSFKDLRTGLETLVKGDETVNGEMVRYLRTYAYDTFSNVQRSIDLNIADTYQLNSFIYSGDVIKDSREFCIERVNGVFTREDLEQWSGQDWAGKNWDVPVEISLGGYNCRHTLMWIPDEAVPYFEEGVNDIPIEEVENPEFYKLPKDEFIDSINKYHEQNYKISDSGRIYTNFMGKKLYIKEDELRKTWKNWGRNSIISENNRNVKDYLMNSGYKHISTSADGASTYYHRVDTGIIRLSDHANTSSMYEKPLLNVFSEEKGAYKDFIEKIKSFDK